MKKETVKVEKTLIAIFDIEGYSKNTTLRQSELVSLFIDSLMKELSQLGFLEPDVFSTGDGAIVSIGRKTTINKHATKSFLEFVIQFVLNMMNNDLILREAVNYSEQDVVILFDDECLIQGNYMQTGHTINTASRIIIYCEPGEILINKSVFDLLRHFALDNEYMFYRNDDFNTKHGQKLETFSYIPNEGQFPPLYNPNSPIQKYKKYNYFPPISNKIVTQFMEIGLAFEIDKVISKAFNSVEGVNYTKTILSANNIVNVLTGLNYDSEDDIYIITREEKDSNFWSQLTRHQYLHYLKQHANKNNGTINQTRIRITSVEEYGELMFDRTCGQNILVDKTISDELLVLHQPNSYFSCPEYALEKVPELNKLLYGCTISKKHKFAIIAIPDPESFNADFLGLGNIGETVSQYKGYTKGHGPMKAIITADERYVNKLIGNMKF